MSKVFIGTSGYIYAHWENGVFYPLGWPKSKKLEYYCQFFKTVELNNTFYRLPEEKIFESWYKKTPKDFVFAVKVSRFITHVKRLINCKRFWQTFLKRCLKLKEKLGPLLFQFPVSFKKDSARLRSFIDMLFKNSPKNLKFAFEFRNSSWCQEEIYKILENYNCAWVIVDSPFWPKVFKVTANFVYVRMHGSKILFSSKYTKRELESLIKKVAQWLGSNKDVYVYFNNDAKGYAVENAKELAELSKKLYFVSQ